MQSEKSQKLINGMVNFGKSVDLTILAEGVETEDQKRMLTSLGCDIIQGYFVSKPVKAEKVLPLLIK